MLKRLIRSIVPRAVQRRVQRLRFGRFTVLQWETDGLLSPGVYERIYETFKGGHIVDDVIEVGGAGGSASVALCWALQESASKAKLVVVEKCEGGTRSKYGGIQANIDRFWNSVAANGVRNRIVLIPEYLTLENGGLVLQKVRTQRIGGLLLDADGHIHRDFFLFWERLTRGAPVVIDDYHESLSPKHALTFAILNQFIAWGLVRQTDLIDTTFFGVKGDEQAFRNFDMSLCKTIASRICDDWKVSFDKSGLRKRDV